MKEVQWKVWNQICVNIIHKKKNILKVKQMFLSKTPFFMCPVVCSY